jgi:hypothetical protein
MACSILIGVGRDINHNFAPLVPLGSVVSFPIISRLKLGFPVPSSSQRLTLVFPPGQVLGLNVEQ